VAAEPSILIPCCPPHHWLIAEETRGRQRWSCQKCGLVRDETLRPVAVPRLGNVCTWSREEVALLDEEPE